MMAAKQKLRPFILQEILNNLSPKEIRDLAYTQELPEPYLSKDGTEVLLKLEKLDRFSESNLSPLAEMMKDIGRKDLAKRVEEYMKGKLEYACNRLEEISLKERIELLQHQTRMLLEQMESLTKDLSCGEVERYMAASVTLVRWKLQQHLTQAARALTVEQASTHGSSGSCSSGGLAVCGKDKQLEVTQRSPVSSRKKPIMPPTVNKLKVSQSPITKESGSKQQISEKSTSNLPLHDQYNSCPELTIPHSIQDKSRGQLVVSTDGVGHEHKKKKPLFPPKSLKGTSVSPPNHPPTSTANDSQHTSSNRTSTRDSGFVESGRYGNDCPSHRVPPNSPWEKKWISLCLTIEESKRYLMERTTLVGTLTY